MTTEQRKEFEEMLNRLPAKQAVAAGQDPEAPAWWTGEEQAYTEGLSARAALAQRVK